MRSVGHCRFNYLITTLYERLNIWCVGHCRYNYIIMTLYERVNIRDSSATAVTIRVANPHWFNADPDRDPDLAFFLIADPHPDPGFDYLKLKKIYSWKFNFYFLDRKLQFTYSPRYRRSLQPSKENIQHFKTRKFCTFFYFCGSFLPSWIRIQWLEMRIWHSVLPWVAIRPDWPKYSDAI
jgi:hypothetical protein